jgi:hypothetical protein
VGNQVQHSIEPLARRSHTGRPRPAQLRHAFHAAHQATLI